jgi:hypothetical protein
MSADSGVVCLLSAPEDRVYSAAKTIADGFKYRNKLGTDAAIEALRDAVHAQGECG